MAEGAESMCTTAANRLNQSWFLIKTRDPVSWMRWDDEIKLFQTQEDRYKKLIIQNPNPREDGYYGGINEKGVAFVATFVHVAEDQISYIRKPYVRLILNADTAKNAVKIILSFYPRIGGNIFIADKNNCFGIEAVPDQYYVETISQPSVKTNHFLHLKYRNLGFDREPAFETWSKHHQKRAEELIKKAQNVQDLKNILRDRKSAETNNAICTTSKEDACFTHSAFIFDTSSATAYYCKGNPLEHKFHQYRF